MMTPVTAAQLLAKHGIRPSHQRAAVTAYLHDNRIHPTSEMVYTALVPEIPTLSRTTVHQTLLLLCEKGLAQKLAIEDGFIRFDADVAPHGHFKCVRCGAVHDFGFSSSAALPRPPEAFELMETHLYCRGVCPACRQAR